LTFKVVYDIINLKRGERETRKCCCWWLNVAPPSTNFDESNQVKVIKIQ